MKKKEWCMWGRERGERRKEKEKKRKESTSREEGKRVRKVKNMIKKSKI
jgi:hypothetical protein